MCIRDRCSPIWKCSPRSVNASLLYPWLIWQTWNGTSLSYGTDRYPRKSSNAGGINTCGLSDENWFIFASLGIHYHYTNLPSIRYMILRTQCGHEKNRYSPTHTQPNRKSIKKNGSAEKSTLPRFQIVRHRGFEPRTTWLKVKCSTNWANIPYFSFECPVPESNQRHEDFQSSALPTELTRHKIAGVGFEPTTFGLWARRASRLLHPAISYFCTWFLK